MSYKEKPQLKLYKYENNSFILQAIIDDYQECSFENNRFSAGQFSITINYNIPNALLFERGLFIQFGNNPYNFGEIYNITDSIGADGKGSQIRIITGYDARYIFKRRIIKNLNNNDNWSMNAKGEICMRNLIQDQCGSGAETKRQLPITNIIPDSANAIGAEYSVSEAYSNLYEVLTTIATQSEIGWRLRFSGSALTLEFYEGVDRHLTVRFDTDYESLSNGEFTDSAESYANTVYVGGKGTGSERDIYEGEELIEGQTPSGLDRFEAWDNQSEMTTEDEYEAEALSMLSQYGQTLEVSGNGLAKCPYEYEKEYSVGDIITIAFSGKSAVVQILSVTEHWTWGNYNLEFSFGKPINNLGKQLQLMLKQIQKASSKTTATESVKWYTIPTATSMPASDVTFDTIGFSGDVGSGATFTLYLDDEKTGSKNYNLYIRNLSGTGKLTLTTGKTGATNADLEVGNYVGRIYVDENGNVKIESLTATSTIASGNNQPATSGGVADALSKFGGIRQNFLHNTNFPNVSYYRIDNLASNIYYETGAFIMQSRANETYMLMLGGDATYPTIKRINNTYSKVIGFAYSGTSLFVKMDVWSMFLSLSQISGNYNADVTITEVTQSDFENATEISISDISDIDEFKPNVYYLAPNASIEIDLTGIMTYRLSAWFYGGIYYLGGGVNNLFGPNKNLNTVYTMGNALGFAVADNKVTIVNSIADSFQISIEKI